MDQTAAHLADHVIPPVPVRQWVISVPKRLRSTLADRPAAVAVVTGIFLDEIEQLLCTAAGVTRDAPAPPPRPRLGGISFLHRFGTAINHHVHLHACVTDGVFMPPADEARWDTPLADRLLTGTSSCRSMKSATSFKSRPTSCPRSTPTASERCRTRGSETSSTADLGRGLRRHEKNATAAGARRFGEPPPDSQNTRSHC